MKNNVIIAEHKTRVSFSFFEKHKNSLPLIVCFCIPCILLLGAYVHMAFHYEKLWLFDTVVHENGKYTLLEVILYFRHFLWEVPMKLIYSLFLVGAFHYYGKPHIQTNRSELSIPLRHILTGCIVSFSLVLLAISVTGHDVGFKDAFAGLFQYRTAELRPLEFGSHWRNHLLSNIVLYSTTTVFVLLYRVVRFDGCWINRKFYMLLPISWGIFIVLTLFFGINRDPFEEPGFLGHQLREIFGSDLSITMLLSLAVLIHLEKKYDSDRIFKDKTKHPNQEKTRYHLLFWLVPAILPTLFLIIKVLTLDIPSNIARLGNTQNWSTLDLFAWHFFEHSLDYIFITSLVYFVYLLTLKIELKRYQ